MSNVLTKYATLATFTITLASLADGGGRQSDLIDNSTDLYPAALVFLKLKSGSTAPTAGGVYNVYLLRGDAATPTLVSDGGGAADAAISIVNAPLLGTIVEDGTASKAYYVELDTAPLGPLGPTWGIAIANESGQALSATETDHIKEYIAYNSEIV